MKRISTRLLQLPILTALFSIVFSVSAEEYKSMIRYDRVWEHVSVHWSDREVYHVKFDGTEEINGKTYHRLVAFRKASYAYGSEGRPYVFDVDDNYYKHEGYIREEDGKVYTLVVTGDSNNEYPELCLYIPDFHNSDSYRIEEKVLYDFTSEEGESYRGVHTGAWGCEMDYKITAIEHVEIDGEDYRLQRIAVYDDWLKDWVDIYDPIVEGMGIDGYGCLTTISFYSVPSCPCMNHIFNRVLSTDGRVLYRAQHDCAEIPLDGFFGVDGINEISEQPESDAPCYDILGRRIADPAPGQLYIKNGRKHIAK